VSIIAIVSLRSFIAALSILLSVSLCCEALRFQYHEKLGRLPDKLPAKIVPKEQNQQFFLQVPIEIS
jgi:hypothetical protein